jgi:hypothetical protein
VTAVALSLVSACSTALLHCLLHAALVRTHVSMHIVWQLMVHPEAPNAFCRTASDNIMMKPSQSFCGKGMP